MAAKYKYQFFIATNKKANIIIIKPYHTDLESVSIKHRAGVWIRRIISSALGTDTVKLPAAVCKFVEDNGITHHPEDWIITSTPEQWHCSEGLKTKLSGLVEFYSTLGLVVV